ncbi:MAG: hypothetical protein PHZ26_04585 [Candidatus Gracilibacteria bacterium]|nr:hypothetical protein [Candidatus Gracilibacteria bacterium]MDD2909004.1 hypothetical protein [Candidatus Gracilibacteria bacterium]
MEITSKSEFYQEISTLLLNIESVVSSPENIQYEAKKYGLLSKNEFHSTIIGSEIGVKILAHIEHLSIEEKDNIFGQIKTLNNSINWGVTLQNEFYFIQKTYNYLVPGSNGETIPEIRKSIIQIIEIKELIEFYKELNTLLDTDFEIPFPHITLFTTSNNENNKLRGIGIYSKEQFEELNPKRIK